MLDDNISNNSNIPLDSNENTRDIKLNKAPSVKKAKLLAKPELKINKLKNEEFPLKSKQPKKIWNETQIFILPLMPNDEEEIDIFADREYRCSYCDELCSQENLECKVCSKVAHIYCLYKRGHLATSYVPVKTEWACADCSDLSKVLTDEEMRKIINIFDKLDFRKNCFVRLDDYMRVKRSIYEEDGYKMTPEQELDEYRRFKLMDANNSGSITWNEFVDFETSNLLSKKNKVELSNHLSKKELIVAKRKFLSYDKEKMKMITREDAKSCYLEYFKKLKEKLGMPFIEHISNCAELLGFKNDQEQNKSTAKTMWPEFVRKITILLLYDRLNSTDFKPKYWKPGVWYSKSLLQSFDHNLSDEPNELNQTENGHFDLNKFSANLSQITLEKEKLFEEEPPKDEESDRFNDSSQIMSFLDSFKPHNTSEYGSFNYVIRSRHNQEIKNEEFLHSEDEDNEEDDNNKLNKLYFTNRKLNPIRSNNILNSTKENISLKSYSNFNYGNIRSKRLLGIENLKNTSIENLSASTINSRPLKNSKLSQINIINDRTYFNEDNQIENLYGSNNSLTSNQNRSAPNSLNFEYSKVTNDIYKNFGRTRRTFNYPQQVDIYNNYNNINKKKPNKTFNESSLKDFFLPELTENSTNIKSNINVNKKINSSNKSISNEKLNKSLINLTKYQSNLNTINQSSTYETSLPSINRSSKYVDILGQF